MWADSNEASASVQRWKVYLVRLVCLVYLVEPNNRDKPNTQTNQLPPVLISKRMVGYDQLFPRGTPMSDHNVHRPKSFRKQAGLPNFIGAVGFGIVLAGLPAQAGETLIPWECSSYTGNAQTRCVDGFAESQRNHIATLQGALQAQQEIVTILKGQLDRQTSSSATLQRQLAQPPAIGHAIPPLFTYSLLGLGLYLGSSWIYKPPFVYRTYIYGPRHYGSHHRGHR